MAQAHNQAYPEPKKRKKRVILGQAVVEEVVGSSLLRPTRIQPSEGAREKTKNELQKIKKILEGADYKIISMSGDPSIWVIHNKRSRGAILRFVAFDYVKGVDYLYRFDGVKVEVPSLELKFKPEWAREDLSVMWPWQRKRLVNLLKKEEIRLSYSLLK